jgi:hypothetical protein
MHVEASVRMPWPLVGTGETQYLPFLLLRWVGARGAELPHLCLLKSLPDAGSIAQAIVVQPSNW